MGFFSAPARIAEFREVLAAGALTADGAMGTALASRGAFGSRCLDELNLSLPALVRDVHQEYLRAGAQIVGTNTFGANRLRLEAFGFGDKVGAINQAGARIAREAARAVASDGPAPETAAFVAGVIGPLGVRLEPFGPATPGQARSLFREQMDALVESGVDLLVLETFQDLNELHQAILAAREAAGLAMVVVAHVSVEEDGSLACGASVREFATRLEAWPVDVIGVNCSSGPRVVLETARKMAAWTTKPLSLMPNAGLPAVIDGRSGYPCSPQYLAGFARDFVRLGARIVGGCCGTTPEHIRQICAAREGVPVEVDRPRVMADEPVQEQHALEPIPAAARSALGAKLAAREFVTIIEMLPPLGPEAAKEIAAAIEYQRAGIGFVATAAEGAGARWSAPAACHRIQQAAGIECVLQVRGGDPRAVQSELLSADALGIRNVLCGANSPGSPAIASNLTRGLDLGGHPLGSQTCFLVGILVGVPLDPSFAEPDETLRRVDFVITEPVFDLDVLSEFLKRIEPYRLPIIAGIRLLTSLADAEFLINERRTPVPSAYLDRMRVSEAGRSEEEEGLLIAREMVERLRGMVAGVYLHAPFGKGQLAMELADGAGSRP
jgi:methionine synthase / methylenetetrahydrofolate reductase(NADPH)